MSHLESVLRSSFSDLSDALSDFRRSASIGTDKGLLERLTWVLESEPLAGFIRSATPQCSFDDWWQEKTGGREFTSGNVSIDWPPDRPLRVGLQVQLCSKLVSGERDLLDFVRRYYRAQSNKHIEYYRRFADELLDPLIRDIRRLAENRALPPILFETMGRLPETGDSTLDELLGQACKYFRDPAPEARKLAVEKLWDAFERTKTLRCSDKKQSANELLREASESDEFLRVLTDEAIALTGIGNNFHIRHFEFSRVSIDQPQHHDYLFHRMYALIHLLLFSATKNR